MLTYRVDEGGRCQAVHYPMHGQFLRVVQMQGLDHILYYPPDRSPCDYTFVVYLSLNQPTVYLTPLQRSAADTVELSRLYAWVMQNRKHHAYPYVHTNVIQPARNESHATPTTISDWCDTQIDAFTLYRCKQQLTQTRPRPGKRSLEA